MSDSSTPHASYREVVTFITELDNGNIRTESYDARSADAARAMVAPHTAAIRSTIVNGPKTDATLAALPAYYEHKLRTIHEGSAGRGTREVLWSILTFLTGVSVGLGFAVAATIKMKRR